MGYAISFRINTVTEKLNGLVMKKQNIFTKYNYENKMVYVVLHIRFSLEFHCHSTEDTSSPSNFSEVGGILNSEAMEVLLTKFL